MPKVESVFKNYKKAYKVSHGLHEPEIGDVVCVNGDKGSNIWSIVHNKGKLYPREGFTLKKVKKAVYGGHGSGSTWVLQKASDDTRNPIWTDPAENKNGEGEREQRHCVVTRSLLGVFEYWFFEDAESEIDAIVRQSKQPIDVLYRCRNRASIEPVATDRDENQGGAYVCVISDYIYFSPEGCRLREMCVASDLPPGATAPVYTREFEKYSPRPKEAMPVVPGIGDVESIEH